VVVIAHSLGVATALQALAAVQQQDCRAFLVAPPEVNNPEVRPKHLMTFGPYKEEPLEFPSIVVASRNDPFGSFEHAGDMANAWGSMLIDAGNPAISMPNQATARGRKASWCLQISSRG
jgi:predicted alpha/beta hydrolase family esterase